MLSTTPQPSSSPALSAPVGLHSRPCPACGAVLAVPVGEKNGWALRACRGCATLYTAQVPAHIASQDYDPFYSPDRLSRRFDFLDRRLDEIVSTFASYRSRGRLLDLGFGAGALLRAAQRAGWEAEGVELSQAAVEHARGLGFRAFLGQLHEAQLDGASYDVITASEVLEHVPDPAALCREILRLLRPGGLLWATTPHWRGLSGRSLGLRWTVVIPPEHLQLYSLPGARALLGRSGFRTVRSHAHGVNPFEIAHDLRQHLRAALGAAEPAQGEMFMRVQSSRDLNAFFSDRPLRRSIKRLANGTLDVLRLGDSIKLRAEK